MKRVLYYKSWEDDFVSSKNQEYKLKPGYRWLNDNMIYRVISRLLYWVVYIITGIYYSLWLHVKIENRQILREYREQGYFLYGNHTQPIGDVIIPAHICKPKRIHTIVSPSNLGVAVIGPLLPMIGAIPISNSVTDMKKVYEAVITRIKQKKCVTIYPEAHVWPYYTKIRPFSSVSFDFPVCCDAPVFVMTTTYYKRKFGKKPGIRVFVDGPFVPDKKISKKERKEKLRKQVYECMENRSKNSTYEYIEYKREKNI